MTENREPKVRGEYVKVQPRNSSIHQKEKKSLVAQLKNLLKRKP